jgi:hypothetical protein
MIPKTAHDLFPRCDKTDQNEFLPIAWVLLAASTALIVGVLSGGIPKSGAAPAMVAVVAAGYMIIRGALISRA